MLKVNLRMDVEDRYLGSLAFVDEEDRRMIYESPYGEFEKFVTYIESILNLAKYKPDVWKDPVTECEQLELFTDAK